MTEFVDGQKIVEKIEKELDSGLSPRLEIIQVGKDPASKTYVKEKLEACERLSFDANLNRFPGDIEEEKVIEKIEKLNSNDEVHGILVQLPLPEQIDNNRIFNALSPEKDVDGLTPLNLGKTLRGENHLVPCSVQAIVKIIENEEIELKGNEATIINNSNLIGKPLSMVLTRKGATVTLCHEDTEDLGKHTREADIVVTATGKSGLLGEEMVTEDTFVIDAGYEAGEKSESVKIENKVSKISPEPGGVGPVTVAMTLKNLVKCYKIQN